MWVIAEYQVTSLFSLKPYDATSTGGKSLLTPTPFAIKMALLDVVIRTEGQSRGQTAWEWLRDVGLAVRVPEQAVVNHTFTRILKPSRKKEREGYDRTIGYREYVYFGGVLGFGLEVEKHPQVQMLTRWLPQINYLGKRGGFVQLTSLPRPEAELPSDFVRLTGEPPKTFHIDSLLQQVDDCGRDVPFERVDIYSSQDMKLGRDRVLHMVLLPYRLVRSSRGFSLYERIQNSRSTE